MRSSIGVLFITLLALTLCGCPPRISSLPAYVDLEEPEPIDVTGDYVHPHTGVTFPPTHAEFKRVNVTKYDEHALDVSIGYDLYREGIETPGFALVNLTAYVYPSRGPIENELAGIGEYILAEYNQPREVDAGEVVIPNSGRELEGLWSHYTFTLLTPVGPVGRETETFLFPMKYRGFAFTVKYRISYPSDLSEEVGPEIRSFIEELRLEP
jgi:hypothetical protein